MQKLTRFDLLIIGKYFLTTNDFINLMKVNHKFYNIVDEYHFNPIPYCKRDFFKNIQTYYIYTQPINEQVLNHYLNRYKFVKIVHEHYYCHEFKQLLIKLLRQTISSTHDIKTKIIQKYSLEHLVLNDNTNVLCSNLFYNCVNLKDVVLPRCEHLRIRSSCFESCYSLKSVKFNDLVCNLGQYTFSKCLNLTNLESFPDCKLNTIPICCFQMCGLTNVELPNSVKIIDSYAFNSCQNLTNIILPNGLKRIDEYAFHDTKLMKLLIPKSVEFIGKNAFLNCEHLESVIFVNQFGSKLKVIKSCVFKNCYKLHNVMLPKNLISIESEAFDNSDITNIELPNTLKYCKGLDCTRLTKLELPNTDVKCYFQNTNISNIEFKNTCETLCNCYSCTKVSTVRIPKTVTKLVNSAFENCTNLTQVYWPNMCKIKCLTTKLFKNCTSLEEIHIPRSVTELNNSTFENCTNLTRVCWPDKCEIKNIPINCFYNCTSLKEITIPKKVRRIFNCAFMNCVNLSHVFMSYVKVKKIDKLAFENTKFKPIENVEE